MAGQQVFAQESGISVQGWAPSSASEVGQHGKESKRNDLVRKNRTGVEY